MAITTVAVLQRPSPRSGASALAPRVPSRVYSPFPSRRLARPMAVRSGTDMTSPPGRTRWPILRGRRERSA